MAKYPHNVGQAVRILSCYGLRDLWVTGGRVELEPYEGYRLPREERMRGYGDVCLLDYEDPLSALREMGQDFTPVAVELVPHAETLPDFVHPHNSVYIFGPEDGTLPGSVLKRCHRFVRVPTLHCLNLACAVGTVLYDREAKR
jgi:tRNA(Leu) C34 or U34 (ribose-2'-O)-methylase TrmL